MESGLKLNELGITFSTLMGHYSPNISDINLVVYGKDKFWKLMKFLEKANNKELRWKTYEEWEDFYKKRNRHLTQNKEIYIKNMDRRKSEGFFSGNLFVIFAVETEDDVWQKWGSETYKKLGPAKIKASVLDNKDSVVRPGCYEIVDSKFLDGDKSLKDLYIKKIVFYSRDYCMLAFPGEKVEASGVIEEVTLKDNPKEKYHRLVIGYFDFYLDGKKDGDYLKIIENNSAN